ncbi:MAG: hypothetical protein JO356_02130, partial [Acidobacteria bacterium]|nr:hypothetical protein [Acidobacteriota bacterium]
MLDPLSTPRRPYDFGDYIDIIRRNIGWLMAPTFAGLVISTIVAFMMTDMFYSEARIRVVPEQLAPDMAPKVTSQDVADRINSMAQSILSRTALESMINTYGLYKKELKKEPLEDVIDQMRKSIIIRPTEGGFAAGRVLPAMIVAFVYPDKYVAQKVCQDLVTRFMNSSSTETSESQQAAYQFLKDEDDHAKQDLEQAEKKIADYREKNAGRLPDEVQLNMSQMGALSNRLDSLNGQAARLNEQRMMLENDLRVAKQRADAIQSPAMVAHTAKLNTLDQQIEDLETNILAMRDRYTEDYPDLQSARDRLAFLKKQRDALAKNVPKTDPAFDAKYGQKFDAQTIVDQIQLQLKANQMETKSVNRDIASVNAGLRNYQARLENVPAGEKEYTDLLRDRDLAHTRYMEAEAKLQRSVLANHIDERKQGQTLEVIDQASLPPAPYAPKRLTIVPVGAVIGLVLGLVVVAFREFKDTSLKNLKDARLYTQLTILGSIPLLENDVVVQRRKQVMWVGWATATIAGLAI